MSEPELVELVATVLERRGYDVQREQRVGRYRWQLVARGGDDETLLVEVMHTLGTGRALNLAKRAARIVREGGHMVLVWMPRPRLKTLAQLEAEGHAGFEMWSPARLTELVEEYL